MGVVKMFQVWLVPEGSNNQLFENKCLNFDWQSEKVDPCFHDLLLLWNLHPTPLFGPIEFVFAFNITYKCFLLCMLGCMLQCCIGSFCFLI
jgi:hypothetical protein